MLDAQPAPDAHARPPLPDIVIDPPAEPERPVVGDAIFAAARALPPVLEAGRALDAATLRDVMTDAFGESDFEGAWVWKDAYEATEAAVVLFMQRFGRGMRCNACAGPDGPRRMLTMLNTIAALEPSHTRRSEEQVRLQQFSTPLPLAYAALQAAAIRPGDVVLEPSAGTDMLAVIAECALGRGAAGHFHLNEYARTRARMLTRLFPQAVVPAFNAEAVADRLRDVRPTVGLMNPPFSATRGVHRVSHDADLRHVCSAFSMLPPGGRMVTITSAHCVPGDSAWTDAFGRLNPPARCVFTMAIDGRAYARRGTGLNTRLTVLERSAEPAIAIDRSFRAVDARDLLDAVTARVPPRLPVAPMPVPAGPSRDLFGKAVAPKPAKRPGLKHASTPETRQPMTGGRSSCWRARPFPATSRRSTASPLAGRLSIACPNPQIGVVRICHTFAARALVGSGRCHLAPQVNGRGIAEFQRVFQRRGLLLRESDDYGPPVGPNLKRLHHVLGYPILAIRGLEDPPAIFGLGSLWMCKEPIQIEEWKRCPEIFSFHGLEPSRFVGRLAMPRCPTLCEAVSMPFESPIQGCAHASVRPPLRTRSRFGNGRSAPIPRAR